MGAHCGFFNVINNYVIISVWSILLIKLSWCVSQSQFYDPSGCGSQAQLPGSNYLCNLQKSSCNTFVVYRVQSVSQSLSSIASLMSANLTNVYQLNKLNISDRLIPGQDIIVPVTCTCLDRYSRVELLHNSSEGGYTSLADVACVVFEGLVKAQVLMDENPGVGVEVGTNVMLNVPLRCACPNLESNRTRSPRRSLYFVTYPVVQNDSLVLIAAKFNVTVNDIANANHIESRSTIFSHTTLLIPIYGPPKVDRTIVQISPSTPSTVFTPDNIVKETDSFVQKHYAVLGGGFIGAILCLILVLFTFVLIRKKSGSREEHFKPFSDNVASRMSNFSPDFIMGMSQLKQSLINFTSDEIREATNNFDQANAVGYSVYVGRTNGSRYAIQLVDSDEVVSHVVYILTRINHLNVVELIGCCYEKPPYLAYEYVENGSLRDCLTSKKIAKQLTWTRRMQIAFDLAVALHYLHYSTNPAYIHNNINSHNVLITNEWRAKISGFMLAKPVMNTTEKADINSFPTRRGYLAPECILTQETSFKTDVYAFGVVLLELLSGKEAVNKKGKCLKEYVMFLSDGNVQETLNSSSEKLREFIDPAVEGEYDLGSGVCLALLAKCCVADDPQLRPNMNDVIKTLSTVV